MKTNINKKLAAIALACVAMVLPAQADSYATIAGSGSSITIHEGETALVMAGAGTFTYGKPGKPCAFIRLSAKRKTTLRETSLHAIPLVGPCKITVRGTDAYLGLRIVATGTRPVTDAMRVASVPPKVSAVRP